MKRNGFVVTFLSFVFTTSALFYIGNYFAIPWLWFHYDFTVDTSGFVLKAGSFLPVIAGLAVSYLAEKIYLMRYRQKLG